MAASDAQDILDNALRQPEKERARIAETLIASLDVEPDQEIEKAWQHEINKRLGEITSGIVKCIPWEDVRDRLYWKAHVQR